MLFWNLRNVAWLAGYLEGEAYFGVQRKRNKQETPYLRIVVSSVDLDVIEKCYHIAGFGSIRKEGPRGLGKKERYVLSLSSQGMVYALCVALFPFMGNKNRTRVRDMILTYKNKPVYEKHYSYNGFTKTLRGWSNTNLCVVKYNTLRSRIFNYGMSFERALTTPLMK